MPLLLCLQEHRQHARIFIYICSHLMIQAGTVPVNYQKIDEFEEYLLDNLDSDRWNILYVYSNELSSFLERYSVLWIVQ